MLGLADPNVPDLGVLLLRVVVGALFVAHGARKQFGTWSGPGMRRFSEVVAGLGFQPALPFAVAATWSQIIGGFALILGAATAPAAALIAFTMLIAIRLQWKRGFWDSGGWQYPGVLLIVLISLTLIGPGRYSLDGALR